MQAMDSTQTETEQPAEETKDVSSVQEVLARMNVRDAQEAVDVVEDADPAEEAEATQEIEQQPEADAKVDGPSVAMKTLAKQHGIKESIIALARNDEQLSDLIDEFAATNREEKKEPEPAATPETPFTLELPEDEFPKDDPIRKALMQLNDHYAKKFDEAYGYLGQLADVALESKKTLEQSTQQSIASEQGEFDDFIDSLGVPSLGNRSKGEISSMAQALRQTIYFQFKDEEKANPRAGRKSLMERVAAEAGFKTGDQKRNEAIRAQSDKRLGTSGSARPLPEKQLSGLPRFRQILSQINERPHNKEQ